LKTPRIPGKRVVWIGKPPRSITVTEAEYRAWMALADGKRKPGLKRSADKAWLAEGKNRAKRSESGENKE
jgi:hypothetical protein